MSFYNKICKSDCKTCLIAQMEDFMEIKTVEEQKEYIKKVKELNKGKNLKYYILTMGCQLNENDSEKLIGMVEKMGYTESKDLNDADLYLINTCCVRENAEEKLFGKLGELKRIKENKDIIIAIGGCMMQEEHITQKLKKSYPFVDILIGTHTLQRLPENLYKVYKKQIQVFYNFNFLKLSFRIVHELSNFCNSCSVNLSSRMRFAPFALTMHGLPMNTSFLPPYSPRRRTDTVKTLFSS